MTFIPNPYFEQDLAGDPLTRRLLDQYAQEALLRAKGLAAADRETGAYEASLKVDQNRLLTDDPAGHIIEFGSTDTPARGILRSAAESTGARVVDEDAR